MMEDMIKEILQKHDIKDEKLAMALAEIYELFLNESSKDQASELRLNAFMKGTQL